MPATSDRSEEHGNNDAAGLWHVAQVAVCPLDHICFPHYILLDEDNPEESLRRYGAVMTRLVGQALR